MISYLHGPLVVLSFFVLLLMWRWWRCINLMGFSREVSRRAPDFQHNDIVAAVFAINPFFLAFADWSGIVLPHQTGPMTPDIAVAASLISLCVCGYLLRTSYQRFEGGWPGTFRSALQTVADLGIISEREHTHALDYIQARTARGLLRVLEEDGKK